MHPIRDLRDDGYGGQDGTLRFERFDTDIGVHIEEGGDLEYAQQCADYLQSLPEKVIDDLCAACVRYCNSFLDDIGEPQIEFASPRDVMARISPSVLIVPPLPIGSPPVIHMELNCDWEEEHGMEWVIRDDKVLYVGGFFGEDPLRDYEGEPKDGWNHA